MRRCRLPLSAAALLFSSSSLSGIASFAPTASTQPPWKQRRSFTLSAVGSSTSDASSLEAVRTSSNNTSSSSFTGADKFLGTGADMVLSSPREMEAEAFELSEPVARQRNGISLEHPSLNFARFLVLVASAVYGTNFAVVKMIDEQMPLALSATVRFGLAAAVVCAMVLQAEARQQGLISANMHHVKQRVPATLAGMEIGGWYCLGYICQAIGLQTADASKSAFFSALAVIVVPLLDSFLRGKQLGYKGMSSIALAILGVGLLQLGSSLAGGAPMTFASGDAFCLAQAALFGVGYWRLEHVSSQYPTQTGRVTAGQLLGVALGSTLFCAFTAEMPTLEQIQGWMDNGFLLGGLAWTALVSTAMALYLETVALKAVSAAELTVLTTSVSLFGSAFAYVTMGEVMSPMGMVGGLLILTGCVVTSLGGGETVDVLLPIAVTTGSLFSNEYLEDSDKGSGLLLAVPVPTPSFVNATVGGLYQ